MGAICECNSTTTMNSKLHLAIIEPQPIARAGYENQLGKCHFTQSVSSFFEEEQFLKQGRKNQFDLILVGTYGYSSLSICHLLRNIKTQFPTAKILHIANANLSQHKSICLESKTDGFITYLDTLDCVQEAIEHLCLHKSYYACDKGKVIDTTQNKISKREQEILQLYQAGFSVKLISTQLFVAEGTVRKHIQNLRERFKCRNVATLLSQCIALGLIAA
ncbi:MAG: hypothetical protein CFE21_16115 [Bacteroidetes bacterium B1(2017)]|nr:MAG: hypothetical protein CFE21_16115 [Bacteroidetes bacterium B1(2017)]